MAIELVDSVSDIEFNSVLLLKTSNREIIIIIKKRLKSTSKASFNAFNKILVQYSKRDVKLLKSITALSPSYQVPPRSLNESCIINSTITLFTAAYSQRAFWTS